MNILITREILDSRICDVSDYSDTETFREYIHEMLSNIGEDKTDEELDNMTDYDRTKLIEYIDEIFG